MYRPECGFHIQGASRRNSTHRYLLMVIFFRLNLENARAWRRNSRIERPPLASASLKEPATKLLKHPPSCSYHRLIALFKKMSAESFKNVGRKLLHISAVNFSTFGRNLSQCRPKVETANPIANDAIELRRIPSSTDGGYRDVCINVHFKYLPGAQGEIRPFTRRSRIAPTSRLRPRTPRTWPISSSPFRSARSRALSLAPSVG